MSIRIIADKYSNLRHLGRAAGKLPPGLENLCMEVYNKGDEVITFTSNHPDWHRMVFYGETPEFWRVLVCKPKDWLFLPHAQYIATVPSGNQEIPVLVSVGDAMFKGNTLPSRPEAMKIRSFVK